MRLYRLTSVVLAAAVLAGCHSDRATGVTTAVRPPNEAFTMQASATRPLIILDGTRVPANVDFRLTRPQDIDHIEVVKGQAAISAFGSDGVNGVILITTKRKTR